MHVPALPQPPSSLATSPPSALLHGSLRCLVSHVSLTFYVLLYLMLRSNAMSPASPPLTAYLTYLHCIPPLFAFHTSSSCCTFLVASGYPVFLSALLHFAWASPLSMLDYLASDFLHLHLPVLFVPAKFVGFLSHTCYTLYNPPLTAWGYDA